MTDLCTCGDDLKSHQGSKGECSWCACKVFDDADPPPLVVAMKAPTPEPVPVRCSHCSGAGAVSGTGVCRACKGAGRVLPADQCRGPYCCP